MRGSVGFDLLRTVRTLGQLGKLAKPPHGTGGPDVSNGNHGEQPILVSNDIDAAARSHQISKFVSALTIHAFTAKT